MAAAAPPAERPPPEQLAPLSLYDISSPLQPPRSFAPNPAKARLALSLKGVPFTTTWVDLPDIEAVRRGLGCPPVRKFADGSDFYTLPMLRDPNAAGAPGGAVVVGDSFDIALHLDAAYPQHGASLFLPPGDARRAALERYESPSAGAAFLVPLSPAQTAGPHAAYAAFNMHVDATFTAAVGLVAEFMPFNPSTAAASRATFAKRAHVASWDDLRVRGEARATMLAGFEASLASLARLFASAEGDGPFLEGAAPSYADAIVGGWLVFFGTCLPAAEWAALRAWHGGVFGRLHDALQERWFVCT